MSFVFHSEETARLHHHLKFREMYAVAIQPESIESSVLNHDYPNPPHIYKCKILFLSQRLIIKNCKALKQLNVGNVCIRK